MLYQDWTSGSGPDITVGGQFNGSSDDLPAGQSYFSYRIYNTEATARTVGTDTITLGYQVNTASGVVSGTVTVPSTYKDGDSIEIHNGILLQLEEGQTVGASDDFYLTAYCNDFDAPETGSNWTGTATVSAAGNYMGTVNKTYTFTVVSDDGTLAASDPSDALTLRWTDSTGDTGTVEVAYSGTNYEIEQESTSTWGPAPLSTATPSPSTSSPPSARRPRPRAWPRSARWCTTASPTASAPR